MSTKSGVADSVLPLPKGGGAVQGIGEKFAPDLHTGTGNFTVPIAVPPGRNGFQPQLALTYSTGQGNGPFGFGWSLTVPGVSRKTSRGIPRYDDARDTFVLSGAEDLVLVASTPTSAQYRPRTEGLFADIQHLRDAASDYWRVRSKDGLTNFYGTPNSADVDQATLAHPERRHDVFAWRLTRTEDTFGNRIEYSYERDAVRSDGPHAWDQLYLREIRYIDHGAVENPQFLVTVRFVYEPRPDSFSDYRAGFEIRTVQRCVRIVVATHAPAEVLARRYLLEYADQTGEAPLNGGSLLTRITVEGVDGDATQALPPLSLGYSRFAPEKRTFVPVRGAELPPASLADPQYELADLFGRGLPDIFQMNGPTVRYWRNLGDAEFDRPREMKEAPAGLDLADPTVQLIDADGDGRIDLVVNRPIEAGFFPLGRDGLWDRHRFRRWSQAPSFKLEDREVRLVDLDGDGVVDALRTGTRLEGFFNDAERGWHATREMTRGPSDAFPDVSFSDPRVQLADMTGDGLQDIVMIHAGAVQYWPSLGYGNFGARVEMRDNPRLPYRYDPRRVLLGDVDGDGAADLLYVEDHRVTLWINRSGNGWSPPIVIEGTPPVHDTDAVRLVDLNGTGLRGILWTAPPRGDARTRMFFLDFTGGMKPYLLDAIDNHVGAVTQVCYASSTSHYLTDACSRETTWRSSLPFPVQVVDSVEVSDAVSGGRLTTRYRYHHGYWDGAEREFRGFARVDQLDGERFPTEEGEIQFSPPTETRTWFHQGPVGDSDSDWVELDLSNEYWSGDPSTIPRSAPSMTLLAGLPRRRRRDAVRALRGSVLRTELYARDGVAGQGRPYTVSERQYGIRVEATAASSAAASFFPFLDSERTTQWERGSDPMTRFAFSDDYDSFGQPRARIDLAVPRGRNWRASAASPTEPYLIALHTTDFATASGANYVADRPSRSRTFDCTRSDARGALELRQAIVAKSVVGVLVAEAVNFYDGAAYVGLPFGQSGNHGALTRTEALVLTDAIVASLGAPPYLDPSGATPWPSEYPADIRAAVPPLAGYVHHAPDAVFTGGFYTRTHLAKHDFQAAPKGRGLVVARQDPLTHETSIEYDAYAVLPKGSSDPLGNVIEAEYDYRVLQPSLVTDANGNRTGYAYSPLGLLAQVATMGKIGEAVGDTLNVPGVRYLYDFTPYETSHQPISVHTIRRVHHANDANVPAGERDDTIETVELSDGFGRLVQTRALAEDVIFADPQFGDAGLPPTVDAGSGNAPAGSVRASTDPPRVVVSGWQVYDNKGRVIEKYEPFFSSGFAYESDAKRGVKATLYYDPRGQLVRTVNPDGSEQTVVLGVPPDLTRPDQFEPTPWEQYTYDANDNAGRTHPATSNGYQSHWNTPTSALLDALGRRVRVVERNGSAATDWYTTQTTYDIRGNVLAVVDALGRSILLRDYDLANRVTVSHELDAGTARSIRDAADSLIETRDAKGAVTLGAFDALRRAIAVWARDAAGEAVTLRERLTWGESVANTTANLRTRLFEHRDEAGILRFETYDFKGNPTEKVRTVIADAPLVATNDPFRVDWTSGREPPLDADAYRTSFTYDALNRIRMLREPADVAGNRATLTPRYNRAGALEYVALDGATYVAHIAYNAKGQRVLIACGNGLVTRYAYGTQTFRLVHLRTERYTETAPYQYTLSGSPLQAFGYTHDLVGNILALADRAPDSGLPAQPNRLDRSFAYDPIYRLATATGRECAAPPSTDPWQNPVRCQTVQATQPYAEQYVYDAVGNLTTLRHQSANAFTRQLPPVTGSNRLQSLTVGGTTFTYDYDACGNLVREGTSRHFVWDHANRLRVFRQQAAGSTPTLIAHYLYDAAGQRVKKLVRTATDRWETTVYVDGTFERHHEKRSSAVRENAEVHVLDGASRIAIRRTGDALDGDPFPTVPSGILYHHGDHLGSSHVVANASGAALNREEYTTYGETSFGSFARKRFRFTGVERDEESGFSHHGLRYYAPWLARWTSADPVGLVDGPNLFLYVGDNPLRFRDSSGTQRVDNVQASPSHAGGGTGSAKATLWDRLEQFVGDLGQGIGSGLTQQGAAEQKGLDVWLGVGAHVVGAPKTSEFFFQDVQSLDRRVAENPAPANAAGRIGEFLGLNYADLAHLAVTAAAAGRVRGAGGLPPEETSDVTSTVARSSRAAGGTGGRRGGDAGDGGSDRGSGSVTVRRFMGRDELKALKKTGLTFDPAKGSGIPTTTRNFSPKNQDIAKQKTGAVRADYQVDLDVTGIPQGPTVVTRRGLPEYPIQGHIAPQRIIHVKPLRQ